MRATVLVLLLLVTGCSNVAPSAPTAAAGVQSGAIVGAYSCAQRADWTDAYIADHGDFDTAFVLLPSGETVYIDWLRDVYHVRGPVCQ